MPSTPDTPAATHRADEPFPDHHNDLAATLKFAWQMVGRGVQDRRLAFHTPVLATQGLTARKRAWWCIAWNGCTCTPEAGAGLCLLGLMAVRKATAP
ncbi:MAG: hypothetical protein WBK51_12680 [Polaromonas sp.]